MRYAYIYDEEIGNFHFGSKHPMKPHRITFTHSLVHSYKLDNYYDIIEPELEPIKTFHKPDFLKNYVSIDNDCPTFPGIDEYGMRCVSGSLNAAKLLIAKEYDLVINWGGGMHHAGKSKPSGFCYANDIVISIIEMLKYYNKVMYIDIDIHHGDAVEEAFYYTNRVFTLSFHKYGDSFFPKTGALCNIGDKEGYRHSCNIPLKTGIEDAHYKYIFEPVVEATVKKFKPDIIVMQCGADSIKGDRIGCFNLSLAGHSECVNFVKRLNLPLLILGGGGYTPRNVSRCWTNETATLCGVSISDKIPESDPYFMHYGPDFLLNLVYPEKFINANSKE
ncbi:hypothetical protein H311_03255, partial [Anncaliia algerae PRA109]